MNRGRERERRGDGGRRLREGGRERGNRGREEEINTGREGGVYVRVG